MEMWMDVDTALSEVPVNKVALIDDTDFKTREESVVYNQAGMDLVWNFVTTAGVYTQTAVTPTTAGDYDWTNQGNGMYSIEIPASGGASINNDTEGFGWFTGFATGILPWTGPIIGFRSAALNNALIDGGDVLDVNLTEIGGVAQSATDLKDFADAGYDPATNKVQGVVLVDTTTTNTDMRGTDSAALASELAKVPKSDGTATWNATALASINGEADTALADFFTSAAQLIDDFWDEVMSGHTTNGTFGKTIKGIAEGWTATEGAVNDASATTTSFITDLTSARDDFYKDAVMVFISEVTGDTVKGVARPIAGYTASTKTVTFDEAWPAAPANTDQFIILATHLHPVSEITADIDANSTQLAAILTDTGTTIPGVLGTPADTDLATDIANIAAVLPTDRLAVDVTFTGGTTTTAVLGNVDGAAASSTDDVYNNRVLVFNAGTLDKQVAEITDYVGSTKTATISAVTTAVTSGHTAILI